MRRALARLAWLVACSAAAQAAAQSTPGYPERVLQWVVQDGQTCPEIAASLYGAAEHVPLLLRYNDLDCGSPLPAAAVLVVPERVTDVSLALLDHATPQVRARPPDGDWQAAEPGLSLSRGYGVNTLQNGTADILFGDRSRVFLAEHTLIIIYQTARSSLTRREDPAAVELDTGELQAGIAVLRGRHSARVATRDGGLVSANSRDTVLRRRGDRTTVSVFEGSAEVASRGTIVQVPSAHGTSFRSALPPEPPHPLPPPPRWVQNPTKVVLAPAGQGVLTASWAPVANAKAYRIELAHDRDFHQPLVRQEVPSDVLSLRAEALPPGRFFLRVRAIDTADFLGIASEVREVLLVGAEVEFGRLQGGQIRTSPYGVVQVEPGPGLELSIDGQAFALGSRQLDLLSVAPRQLYFRQPGGETLATVDILMEQLEASIGALARERGRLDVLAYVGLAPDEARRAGLRLWIQQSAERREIALAPSPTPERLAGVVEDLTEHVPYTLELVDVRGVVLASKTINAWPRAPTPPRRLAPAIGVFDLSPTANYAWWEPHLATAASAGVLAPTADLGGQAWFSAAAAWGPLGFTGRVVSDLLPHRGRSDNSAWLGARVALPTAPLHTGLGLRASLPVSVASPGARLEPSVAAGTELGRGSVLMNLGSRVNLEQLTRPEPRWQVFGILGGTYQLPAETQAYGALDFAFSPTGDRWCGGGSLGLSRGGRVTGSLGIRLSPCSDMGWVTLQAGVSLDNP